MNKWNLKRDLYDAELTVEELVNAIYVFDRLQRKYPNDETVATSIEILRDEVCQMFGGSIYNDDE
jgi:hypothetical protein